MFVVPIASGFWRTAKDFFRRTRCSSSVLISSACAIMARSKVVFHL